ncbi:dipeptidase [Polycladidibacter stylochi]|uniref:dipeptidase n=1 Tax=Polycladidibacter stylochi TaxID=1807766 RepID=UPI00082DD4A2|nr:dipeptidase [Pseudovibrio stylochi]
MPESAQGTPLVFDGHNDVLLKLVLQKAAGKPRNFMQEVSYDHIDLVRAQRGGLGGGLFALFVPPRYELAPVLGLESRHVAKDDFGAVPQGEALAYTMAAIAEMVRIERKSGGKVVICKNSAEVSESMRAGSMAVVLHMEGAEAIDRDFNSLEVLYQLGVRSIGPVWSRPTIFAYGVPMIYGRTPDIGPGLTDLGKELVRQCNHLGIMLDMAHLNEKGFWDVAAISDKPIVATHSNVFAICPHARNLTDKQLDAIAESKGLVGINFATSFLAADGKPNPDLPLEQLIKHTDYLIEKLGEDGVALGSDFDGCGVPKAIGDASGLPNLLKAFAGAGYGAELIEKIAHKNWLSVMQRSGI